MSVSIGRMLSFMAIVAIALAGCDRTRTGVTRADAAAFEAGGLRVEISTPPGGIREGVNELRLRVRDAQGRPVDDAHVSVQYSMSMAGAAPMGGRAVAEPAGGGEYRAEPSLDMAGTWQVAIAVQRPSGEIANAQGSMRTGAPGIRIAARDLAAGTAGEAKGGTVRVDPERLQKIGVRFALAERAPLVRTIRALGRVTWDETKLVDVTLKVGGFVRELHADSLGAKVEKGESLFSVYSPELYAAQVEYLQALHGRSDPLRLAARSRLRLWDVSERDVTALEKRDAPFETLPVRSPATGVVVEKNVVEGAAFAPGTRLFRIARPDQVWIEAEVYASDLALVSVGQTAAIRAPYLATGSLDARVAYVLPSLASESRTARVRLELENADLALRPEMFVDVELRADLGERLLVPMSAVIVAGDRRVVFVDRGSGELEPRVVTTGAASEDRVEVLTGLEAGERVVASGNFLIAAESRIQSALEQW
jgi:Cu(I)/Ag(I) efflux system membrane fusion protein